MVYTVLRLALSSGAASVIACAGSRTRADSQLSKRHLPSFEPAVASQVRLLDAGRRPTFWRVDLQALLRNRQVTFRGL
jgi:hypothetical protein